MIVRPALTAHVGSFGFSWQSFSPLLFLYTVNQTVIIFKLNLCQTLVPEETIFSFIETVSDKVRTCL
jgi:hypothetical protein